MAQATYKTAIEFVAKWEGWGKDGGYTHDPRDPGGETKWGISKRAHPNEDIRNMTLERALELYRTKYWDVYTTRGYPLDSAPPQYAVAVFDSGVNCGVGRAWKWHTVSIKEKDPTKHLLGLRLEHYLSLKNPTYLKGWLNRLNDLKKLCEIIRAENEPS